ncbi:serine hydrolase [Mycolicibacterium sp. 018/SC-01/001]|uniref:serine hydrolase domain-containing protein n=1 Tax=Mycolicibacterium sp. 018/SC-01/001 TaxID=2592069 RepID=UPI00163DB450|nr:serine hydrolase domain-containing protein [Mycolicibacterium sp. 018/SC-01/001]
MPNDTAGDEQLIVLAQPHIRTAGLLGRVSVVHLCGDVRREAHFGADADTIYEIGSVTKTLTAQMFADAVDLDDLRPDTTVGELLDLRGSPVADATLSELASHRSGLPRISTRLRDRAAAVFAVARRRNPYTADVPTMLTHARAAICTGRGEVAYSNLGMALLGQALAAHSRVGYPELLEHRAFRPLGMTHSTTPLTARDLPPRAPTGFTAEGRSARAWTMNAYAPAGGVRSTSADMARFAEALLDRRAPGLGALEPRWSAGGGRRIGYGWFTDRTENGDITWHNGRTGGFTSMLALDRPRHAAVVVLADRAVPVDDIAIRLLVEPR